jgi:hypothetical protein
VIVSTTIAASTMTARTSVQSSLTASR